MPKSRNRKNQKKKAKARTENLRAKQNAFIRQFQQNFNQEVSKEIEAEAQKVKEQNQIDGTEERTLIDTTMSTPPTK